jgi:HEAT repeats
MARRWIKPFFGWFIGLTVVGIGIALCFPAGQWGAIGLIHGDRFYHGRPASYWRFELGETTFGGRERAAAELKQGGPSAVPILVDLLQNKDKFTRYEAADVLAEIGPPAQAAVPALQQAMEEPDQHLRWRAGKALNRIAPEANLQGWPAPD